MPLTTFRGSHKALEKVPVFLLLLLLFSPGQLPGKDKKERRRPPRAPAYIPSAWELLPSGVGVLLVKWEAALTT